MSETTEANYDDLALADGHRELLEDIVRIAAGAEDSEGYWDDCSIWVTGSVSDGLVSSEANDIDVVIDTTRDGVGYAPTGMEKATAREFAAEIVAALNDDELEATDESLAGYALTDTYTSVAAYPLRMEVEVPSYDTELDLMVRDDPPYADGVELYRG